MNVSKLLGHLQDIHDAPDDGRDFVAFEKRPDMLAAGVSPKAFDRFDFGSRAAVQREMGLLGGGPIRPPEPPAPIERQIVESNPEGFVARGDIMAEVLSDYEQLAQAFIANNMRHLTYEGGATWKSPPPSELVESITELSRTERGRQFLAYARDNELTLTFLKDLKDEAGARAQDGELFYNPLAIEDYQKTGWLPGDEHETANLTVQLAHEFPHLPAGKAVLGLPQQQRDPSPGKGLPTTIAPSLEQQKLEEFLAIREGENPVRKSLGLPLRRSWRQPDDYFNSGRPR